MFKIKTFSGKTAKIKTSFEILLFPDKNLESCIWDSCCSSEDTFSSEDRFYAYLKIFTELYGSEQIKEHSIPSNILVSILRSFSVATELKNPRNHNDFFNKDIWISPKEGIMRTGEYRDVRSKSFLCSAISYFISRTGNDDVHCLDDIGKVASRPVNNKIGNSYLDGVIDVLLLDRPISNRIIGSVDDLTGLLELIHKDGFRELFLSCDKHLEPNHVKTNSSIKRDLARVFRFNPTRSANGNTISSTDFHLSPKVKFESTAFNRETLRTFGVCAHNEMPVGIITRLDMNVDPDEKLKNIVKVAKKRDIVVTRYKKNGLTFNFSEPITIKGIKKNNRFIVFSEKFKKDHISPGFRNIKITELSINGLLSNLKISRNTDIVFKGIHPNKTSSSFCMGDLVNTNTPHTVTLNNVIQTLEYPNFDSSYTMLSAFIKSSEYSAVIRKVIGGVSLLEDDKEKADHLKELYPEIFSDVSVNKLLRNIE